MSQPQTVSISENEATLAAQLSGLVLTGTKGDDTLIGGDGDDTLTGLAGDDLLDGAAGNDTLDGGKGRDILDGGPGSDTLRAGPDSDTVIHVVNENYGALDDYDGGSKNDTLQLVMTQNVFDSQLVQDEIAAFESFLATGSNADFAFTSLDGDPDVDLIVRDFEFLQIVIDNSVNNIPLASAVAATTNEDAAVFSLDLLDPTVTSDLDVFDTLAITCVTQDLSASDRDLLGNFTVIDGVLGFDPSQFNDLALGENESLVFTYDASDGIDTASNTITVPVEGRNDAPMAVGEQAATNEDTGFNVTAAGGLLANDTDPDTSDILTISAVNGNAANVGSPIVLASGARLAVGADGGYGYDPNGRFEFLTDGETAADTFNYSISDNNGGTDTGTVNITITGINDAPDAVDRVISVGEDSQNNALGLTSPIDPEGDPLIVVVDQVPEALQGVVSVGPGGRTVAAGESLTIDELTELVFTPAPDHDGPVNDFLYTVTDDAGAAAQGTVAIGVVPANDPPRATDDQSVTDEDTPLSVAAENGLLANDIHPDAGDTLTVTAVNGNAGNVGGQILLTSGALLTVNADGGYGYDPNGAFEALDATETATDSFTYTVSDGNGGEDIATATVTIDGRREFTIDVSTLDGTNGFRLDGENEFDAFGAAVSGAGDINGDGFDDIIVGTFSADTNNGSLSGSSYVVFGGSEGSFAATVDLATLDGMNGFRLDGLAAADALGVSVSGAGDINGDGFADLIVGAPVIARSSFPEDDRPGTAYVVYGGPDGTFSATPDLATLDGTNGFRLNGGSPSDIAGVSVSGAGDVNGDGLDDLIVGAPASNPNGISSAGSSYVVFGAPDGGIAAALDLDTLDGSNGFRLDGAHELDFSGVSVSAAGDVNGDGVADLIIGAPTIFTDGSVEGVGYVVFGRPDGIFPATFDLASLDGTNGFRLDGLVGDDSAGFSVSNAGDVNGDGFADVIVGASTADPNGRDSGSSYVVFGGPDGTFSPSFDLALLDGSNGFRLDGPAADDRAGESVSGAGDVNGDGFSDLIVGGPATTGFGDVGASYLIFGGPGGSFSATFDLGSIDGTNGLRLDGVSLFDGFGNAVSGAGDVDGDGFDDLIVGAPGADPNGFSSGSSFVVFGDDFTDSVDQIGTVNGDNLVGTSARDVIVAAQGNDIVDGLGGDDLIKGAAGDDTLDGGAGNDRLMGGNGADTLLGGGDDDRLEGGAGDDVLEGGSGNDWLLGQEGDDVFVFRTGDGADTIIGFAAGAATTNDEIDLTAFGLTDTVALDAIIADNADGNAIIDLGNGDSVTLLGVGKSDLDLAEDFLI